MGDKWLGHDKIKPFQQAKADGLEGDLEERFKPWLNNGAGCYPYAAVDANGYHGYDHSNLSPSEPLLMEM